jgi:hypothetical protein
MNIKKIIKEEIDDFDWVNEIETPLSWLTDNFGDLKRITKGDTTYYVNDENVPMFHLRQKVHFFSGKITNGDLYVSFGEIWEVLGSRFDIEFGEINEIMKSWVSVTYGLSVPSTTYSNWWD